MISEGVRYDIPSAHPRHPLALNLRLDSSLVMTGETDKEAALE